MENTETPATMNSASLIEANSSITEKNETVTEADETVTKDNVLITEINATEGTAPIDSEMRQFSASIISIQSLESQLSNSRYISIISLLMHVTKCLLSVYNVCKF